MKGIFIFLERWKWVLISIMLLIAVFIYRFNNPIDSEYFPKCVFKMMTGYDCPGCGSQRAIFYLLNFKFIDAIKGNLLFVVLFPYILIGAFFDLVKVSNEKINNIKNKIYGNHILIILVIIIVIYWFFRNTSIYHHWMELM